MFTRHELDAALDSGRLFVKMRNGNAWRCRRNGATRTWKRDPARFEIPFKAGFKEYGTVSNQNNSEVYFEIR